MDNRDIFRMTSVLALGELSCRGGTDCIAHDDAYFRGARLVEECEALDMSTSSTGSEGSIGWAGLSPWPHTSWTMVPSNMSPVGGKQIHPRSGCVMSLSSMKDVANSNSTDATDTSAVRG